MSTAGSGAGSSQPPRSALIADWVSRAEADLAMARREEAFTGPQNLNMIGFLLQQSIERLMKAILLDRGITPPYTHDLVLLDGLLGTVRVGPCATVQDLTRLSLAAVKSRYPGTSLTMQVWRTLCRSPMRSGQGSARSSS